MDYYDFDPVESYQDTPEARQRVREGFAALVETLERPILAAREAWRQRARQSAAETSAVFMALEDRPMCKRLRMPLCVNPCAMATNCPRYIAPEPAQPEQEEGRRTPTQPPPFPTA